MKHLHQIALSKAKDIAQNEGLEKAFQGSWNWLLNFRKRRGLDAINLYGEGAEVDKNDPNLLEDLCRLNDIISQYHPENIYNMDKTGLFYWVLPRYTLLMPREDIKTVQGKKKAKDPVMLIVCANATGSHKIPCSLIGKAVQPACIHVRQWPIPYFTQ